MSDKVLTFKTDRWHVKLVRWFWGGSTPKSLCLYFWAAVTAIVVPTAMALLALLFAAALSIAIITDETVRLVFFNIVAVALAGALLGVLIFWWEDQRRGNPRGNPPKQPSPIVEYILAKKRKVCPVVKIEGGPDPWAGWEAADGQH
tara:strand:- start:909 stop:1346 length:438 start_codon:yes stop_codon:yes gene_type:complete